MIQNSSLFSLLYIYIFLNRLIIKTCGIIQILYICVESKDWNKGRRSSTWWPKALHVFKELKEQDWSLEFPYTNSLNSMKPFEFKLWFSSPSISLVQFSQPQNRNSIPQSGKIMQSNFYRQPSSPVNWTNVRTSAMSPGDPPVWFTLLHYSLFSNYIRSSHLR